MADAELDFDAQLEADLLEAEQEMLKEKNTKGKTKETREEKILPRDKSKNEISDENKTIPLAFSSNIDPNKGIIPVDIWNTMTQSFLRTEKGNCKASYAVSEYVARGTDINRDLRDHGHEYDKLTKCLDKLAIPLYKLLRDHSRYSEPYIILYRYTHRKFSPLLNQGYMSTSNMQLAGFGGHAMKIYVPLTTKVLLANISKQTKLANSYEIILPKGTNLVFMGTDKEDYNYYMVPSESNKDNDIMRYDIRLAGVLPAE